MTAASKTITVICGPTASGKSALAVRIAQQKNGVIINADSLQLYDALPILTAQPDAAEKALVPHRLYAVLPPEQRFSAQQWRDSALAEIETAFANNRHPILVGGTGLYLKALMQGLSAMPDIPHAIRADSIALQSDLGNPGFHAALAVLDPVMAARLNPNDTQRLIRAYEVIKATGESLTVWQAAPLQGPPAGWRFHITILTPDRAVLHQRCNARFDRMLQNGAFDEVAAQIDLPDDAPVANALGFRPLRDFLTGKIPRDQAIERSKAETRQYAKRQDTWFRNQIHPRPGLDEVIRVS